MFMQLFFITLLFSSKDALNWSKLSAKTFYHVVDDFYFKQNAVLLNDLFIKTHKN